MLLHGLHDGEKLVCQHSNIMEDDLEWEQEKPNSQPTISQPPEHRRQKQTGQSQEELRGLRAKEVGKGNKEQSPGSTRQYRLG